MQGWPFLHSADCLQSCAVASPAGAVHEPPLGTAWQVADPSYVDVFSEPQQLSPEGHSQAYWQWNGDALPEHPASVPATHTPVGLGRAGVTQHVLEWRSHVAVPWQTGAVYVLQSTPSQVPPRHVWGDTHALPLFCQAPLASQVCGCWPLHWVCPSAHDPWQAPFTHVWFAHAAAFCQLPAALHVCGWLPLHWMAPGLHEPVHTPPTHAELVHITAAPQASPAASHVCTPLPEHCVAPGRHTAAEVPLDEAPLPDDEALDDGPPPEDELLDEPPAVASPPSSPVAMPLDDNPPLPAAPLAEDPPPMPRATLESPPSRLPVVASEPPHPEAAAAPTAIKAPARATSERVTFESLHRQAIRALPAIR